jgi:flagellar biosynthesis chaperone FliJ
MENFRLRFQFEETIEEKEKGIDTLNEQINECDDETSERNIELERVIEMRKLEITRKYARRERKEQRVLDMQETLK